MPKSVLCMFSSKSFIVSGLKFKSLIYFEFIFVYGVRKRSVLSMVLQSFILRAVKFSHHRLLKMLSFLCCIFLPYLLKIRCPQINGFVSGLSILFQWPIYLFLCQYHTVLMTVALQYTLKSGSLILIFFLKLSLFSYIFRSKIDFHTQFKEQDKIHHIFI